MKPHLQIALALIWRDGKIFIARRPANADHLPDIWEFPGGKIESNETPAAAAKREAREEVGLEVEVIAAREIIEWEYAARRVSLHPFDCDVVGGDVEAVEGLWVTPETLKTADFPDANAELIEQLRRAG